MTFNWPNLSSLTLTQSISMILSTTDSRSSKSKGIIPLNELEKQHQIYIHITCNFKNLFTKSIKTAQIWNLISMVIYSLFKYSILVSDTITIGRIPQGSQGVQEACCQSSKTSISKTSIFLYFLKFLHLQTNLFKRQDSNFANTYT